MPFTTLKIIIAIIFLAHGLGHVLGIFSAFGMKLSQTHSPDSWLFSGFLGDTFTRIICIVFMLVSLLLYVGAGFGLLNWLVPQSSWLPLAFIASIISLAAIILFWNALPFTFPNKIGAIIVNAGVIILFQIMHWPPELFVE